MDFHVLTDKFLKIGLHDPDIIDTGRQIGKHILALSTGRHSAGFARIPARDRNGGVRHHRAGTIADDAAKASGGWLRRGGKSGTHQQQKNAYNPETCTRLSIFAVQIHKLTFHGIPPRRVLSKIKGVPRRSASHRQRNFSDSFHPEPQKHDKDIMLLYYARYLRPGRKTCQVKY